MPEQNDQHEEHVVREQIRDHEARIKDMHEQRMAAQNKYTYFLLTAAAAAIALGLRLTESSSISWSQLPLGAAISLWAASFYYGCQRINALDLHADAQIQFARNAPAVIGQAVARIQADLLDTMTKRWSDANKYANRQFCCLTLGAVMFVSWHIGEMILRTTR